MQDRQIYIADTLHKTILVSEYEKEIISTPLFNRLHNISQNSTAYLTFPTNRTKRFEHSIGTMKLCGDILYFSFVNSNIVANTSLISDFKDAVEKFIINNVILAKPDNFRAILGDTNLDRDKLMEFSELEISNVFYNHYIPANVQKNDERFMYLLMFQCVRICALLHDLGHPPFSHITEYAMQNVYSKIKTIKDKNSRQKRFCDILEQYDLDKESSQLHEIMGNRMTEALVSDLLHGNSVWHEYLSFADKYFKVLVLEIVKAIFEEKSEIFKSLHSIVDGIIDGDRLDYVTRDMLNSGINSGNLEYDRLISSMQIFKNENTYLFVSNAKTINTLEDFFLKRWNLYKNIVFHHRVIKTDSILKICVENIMYKYLTDNEVVSKSADYVLPYDISGLWNAISIEKSNIRYFNSLIQWDDSWLYTILKKVYFEDYYASAEEIKLQLEELLSNKKNYFSIIKNSSEFSVISASIEKNLESSDLYKNNEFEKVKNIILNQSNNASILYSLEAYFEAYPPSTGYHFKNFLKESIANFIKKEYNGIIKFHIIEFKEIKTGLTKEPNIYKNNELFAISRVSNIKAILSAEKYALPYLYIYLNFDMHNHIFDETKKNQFLTRLGTHIAKCVIESIK